MLWVFIVNFRVVRLVAALLSEFIRAANASKLGCIIIYILYNAVPIYNRIAHHWFNTHLIINQIIIADIQSRTNNIIFFNLSEVADPSKIKPDSDRFKFNFNETELNIELVWNFFQSPIYLNTPIKNITFTDLKMYR